MLLDVLVDVKDQPHQIILDEKKTSYEVNARIGEQVNFKVYDATALIDLRVCIEG